jgi:hypothetical protein
MHVPDWNLARYRQIKRMADLFKHLGDTIGPNDMEDSTICWRLASKYKAKANELRTTLKIEGPEPWDTAQVPVARTIGELAGLPLHTRIATNHGKLLRLDEGYGSQYWFEEGELTPYSPIVDWLPALILPAPVDPRA